MTFLVCPTCSSDEEDSTEDESDDETPRLDEALCAARRDRSVARYDSRQSAKTRTLEIGEGVEDGQSRSGHRGTHAQSQKADTGVLLTYMREELPKRGFEGTQGRTEESHRDAPK